MSANNLLKITRKGNTYFVNEVDADTGAAYGFEVQKNSLEEAIRAANQYMGEEVVEYGLSIDV